MSFPDNCTYSPAARSVAALEPLTLSAAAHSARDELSVATGRGRRRPAPYFEG
jgi:hypothetical protein